MLLPALLMWKIWLLPHTALLHATRRLPLAPWPLSVCVPLIFNYAAHFWALSFLLSLFLAIICRMRWQEVRDVAV